MSAGSTTQKAADREDPSLSHLVCDGTQKINTNRMDQVTGLSSTNDATKINGILPKAICQAVIDIKSIDPRS